MAFTLTEKLRRHVHEDEVVWLGTVSGAGRPTTRPVWFHWDGSAFRVYTSPGSAKVRHLRAAPGASLNFNCSPEGEDVAVVLGTAEVVDDPGPPSADAGYMARYAARLPGIGFTPAEFDASYRVLLRIVPERSWEL
ncbi:TIGR03667 family PPOX class F420-dependent oxidoreductase [Nocardiopsis composta]|uniref:PPOX class probable F420-dependent enzyme n=1 Tax=Nocardiopsis composta TaxID=157465 RepID=A0A7W8QPJ2_9ACTN|nr:TIGR03667 family PPOX class F420-dependent oxidoreductase [Nocardiopsis composta]MBB5434225.1 PPOX class probable F420-dependent enzyme [Nocardiopsis composta]